MKSLSDPPLQRTGGENAPRRVISVWWAGAEDSPWCKSFQAWAVASAAEFSPELSWRIRFEPPDAVNLPRIIHRGEQGSARDRGMIVWLIPRHGIADTIARIGLLQRTRPGYLHVTCGLASPVERQLLSEVGARAHVQQPHQWRQQNALIGRWIKSRSYFGETSS